MRKMSVILGMFVIGLSLAGIASGQVGLGGGGMAGGIGRQNPVQLLNNASVKKELDLSDEQLDKLSPEILKAIGKVLNETQMKRFSEIELQQRGNNAFKDEASMKNRWHVAFRMAQQGSD